MTKEEQENFEESLNKNYFEECNGVAHLQVMEMLSTELSMKAQKLEQKLSQSQRETLSKFLAKVKELQEFDESEVTEDTHLELPQVTLVCFVLPSYQRMNQRRNKRNW